LALAVVGCGNEGSLNQLKLMMIHRHIDPADDGGADDRATGVDASAGVDEGRERGRRRQSYGRVMFADGLGIGNGRETGATEGVDDRGADEGASEARTTGL
jgi:hypothetical protein